MMVGTGSLQERLASAYMVVCALLPTDFPDFDSSDLWADITGQLTFPLAAGNERIFRAATGQMDDKKATEIAGMFCDLSLTVLRLRE